MNIKFIVNDYILMWSLLFQNSITESIYKLKQNLWLNYKIEYNQAYGDKNLIIKDHKNFIPNDDTVYNIILENHEYEKIKKSTENYRMELMKLWDNKTNKIYKEIAEISRLTIEDYTVYVVDSRLNFIDRCSTSSQEFKSIIIGKPIEKKNPNKVLLELCNEILKKEIKDYRAEGSNKIIADAVIDLAINNELATRLYKNSCYFCGKQSLVSVKRQIYPYWLLYLKVPKEELIKYMSRDKIAFDVDKLLYKKDLSKMNINQFIEFCIENKKTIMNNEKVEVI